MAQVQYLGAHFLIVQNNVNLLPSKERYKTTVLRKFEGGLN